MGKCRIGHGPFDIYRIGFGIKISESRRITCGDTDRDRLCAGITYKSQLKHKLIDTHHSGDFVPDRRI